MPNVILNLLHYYRNSSFPQWSWALQWNALNLLIEYQLKAAFLIVGFTIIVPVLTKHIEAWSLMEALTWYKLISNSLLEFLISFIVKNTGQYAPLDPACPLLKVFIFPPLFSIPPFFRVFYIGHTSLPYINLPFINLPNLYYWE